jgi:DNA-binding transcriptional ArsR family regulator
LNIPDKKEAMEKIDTQTRLLKALTHPVRLAILDILRDGEQCVCHIEAYLGARQAYISQQLAVLREAGLLQIRRDGWNIYYQVIKPDVYDILDLAAKISDSEVENGIDSGREDVKEVNCPCPKCNETEIVRFKVMEEKC